jgi:hypothetical protein
MDVKDFMPDEAVIAGIRKDIETYEELRAAAHRQVLWRVPVFVGLVLIVAAFIAYAFNDFANPYEQWLSTPHVFLYLGTVVAASVAGIAAMRPATKLRQSFRDRLLPIIFGFIKEMHYANGVTPASFDRLPRQAAGGFDRQHFDDSVSGKYEDFWFELYEAKLLRGAGKSAQTMFRGVITAFPTETSFPGLLVATKRVGTVSKFFRDMFGDGGLEPVESGIAMLDEAYEFRTDNAGAARPLVAGNLAKVLQWLGETWPGEPPRVALSARDGFLLLPQAKDFFELPGISTPIDYRMHIEPIVADMVALLATASLVRKVGAPDDQPAEGGQP